MATLSQATLDAIAAAVTAAVAAAIPTSAPVAPTAASAHWTARDIACPRKCGRADFRTANGANGAHRRADGSICK